MNIRIELEPTESVVVSHYESGQLRVEFALVFVNRSNLKQD